MFVIELSHLAEQSRIFNSLENLHFKLLGSKIPLEIPNPLKRIISLTKGQKKSKFYNAKTGSIE